LTTSKNVQVRKLKPKLGDEVIEKEIIIKEEEKI